MSEPKEYFVEPSAITGFINYTTNRLSLVVVYRANDPAVTSALKDSEDLATIKYLVGAHSVDEIKQWKRSHEALEKLERMGKEQTEQTRIGIYRLEWYGTKITLMAPDGQLFTAPSLISAIEQIPVKVLNVEPL